MWSYTGSGFKKEEEDRGAKRIGGVMPGMTVSAFIDEAEVRQSNKDPKEKYLLLKVFVKVSVGMLDVSPLLSELESSLGEKIDLNNEAQIAGLKGKDIRVHLTESHQHSDLYGERVVIDDFRSARPE